MRPWPNFFSASATTPLPAAGRRYRIASVTYEPDAQITALEQPAILGSHAERVCEPRLEPARDAPGRHPVVEQLAGAHEQPIDRVRAGPLLEEDPESHVLPRLEHARGIRERRA